MPLVCFLIGMGIPEKNIGSIHGSARWPGVSEKIGMTTKVKENKAAVDY